MSKRKVVVWIIGLVTAVVLTVGAGHVTETFGLDIVPAAHANNCSGGNGGGGC